MSSKFHYYKRKAIENRQIIESLKAKYDSKRSLFERIADFFTAAFGSITFLMLNVVWFGIWIILNTGLIIEPFDPYPFGFLTMMVSLEAIVLAIVVLISQNRQSRTAELREELDLQMDIIGEEEITKVMQLVVMIAEKQGISTKDDPQLIEMLKPTDRETIELMLEKQVG